MGLHLLNIVLYTGILYVQLIYKYVSYRHNTTVKRLTMTIVDKNIIMIDSL